MLLFRLTLITTLLIGASLLGIPTDCNAQDVRLTNPSFEDQPRKGIYDARQRLRSSPILGWFDCGAVLFPTASPPDIHQGSTNFWDNELSSAHGKTYITLVVREDDTYETISQKVMGTIKAGKCYNFSISLAKSKTYLSHTAVNQHQKQNFIVPAVLRVWGGNSNCDIGELLAESEPVNNTDWETYEFFIEPSSNYTYITLEAYFKTPTFFGYNGNICLDNASHFVMVSCDDPQQIIAEAKVGKEVKESVLPSFRNPKKEKEVFANTTKAPKIDTIVYKKPKKLLVELERKKLKLGQHIKIDHLYFGADTDTIGVESFEVLNEIYTFMKENEDVKIEIGGHTNGAPSHQYCDHLSNGRAKAVANYLISKGIVDNRITYKGYGKRKPIASNGSEKGRKKNQRVEIKILSLG